MILNIETATTNCSVSLAQNGLVVSYKEYADIQYSHAEQLHLFITEVLAAAGKGFKDLSAVAVSKGPGSYTGLRIGVSAAKGLCYALQIPLIAVPTLQSLAMAYKPLEGGLVIPMLDARRMEVYMAAYDHQMREVLATKAQIIEPSSLSEFAGSYDHITLVGSGAEKVLEVVSDANIVGEPQSLPSAKDMVALSEQRWKSQEFEDLAYFEPFYLKDFMAPPAAKKSI